MVRETIREMYITEFIIRSILPLLSFEFNTLIIRVPVPDVGKIDIGSHGPYHNKKGLRVNTLRVVTYLPLSYLQT